LVKPFYLELSIYITLLIIFIPSFKLEEITFCSVSRLGLRIFVGMGFVKDDLDVEVLIIQ